MKQKLTKPTVLMKRSPEGQCLHDPTSHPQTGRAERPPRQRLEPGSRIRWVSGEGARAAFRHSPVRRRVACRERLCTPLVDKVPRHGPRGLRSLRRRRRPIWTRLHSHVRLESRVVPRRHRAVLGRTSGRSAHGQAPSVARRRHDQDAGTTWLGIPRGLGLTLSVAEPLRGDQCLERRTTRSETACSRQRRRAAAGPPLSRLAGPCLGSSLWVG